MQRATAWVLVLSFVLASCATYQPPVTSSRTYEGAAAGGVLGATAGALIDKHNRWRGAVIGGALGAVLGGTVTEVASRAAREAAAENRLVAYQSTDGFQRVEAEPVGSPRSGCRQVQERVYQDGQLVREQIRQIC